MYTVGHANRSEDEFLALLTANGVSQLADVRTAAGSRRNPQFGKDRLPDALAANGIRYVHLPALGGFRRPLPDSPNRAWRNTSFRGFADYMQTEAFQEGLERLLELAGERVTAIMCAEAVPWRCHRSLIADALLVRGVEVVDIMSSTSTRPHRITPFARVAGLQITYPDAEAP